jgi:hypothetical protein
MDIIKRINKIIGKSMSFVLDVRCTNEDYYNIILTFKSNLEDISFEPLILVGDLASINDIFDGQVLEHYNKVKEDIISVEKFLGAKTAKQTDAIKKNIKTVSDAPKQEQAQNDDGFDLDF